MDGNKTDFYSRIVIKEPTELHRYIRNVLPIPDRKARRESNNKREDYRNVIKEGDLR